MQHAFQRHSERLVIASLKKALLPLFICRDLEPTRYIFRDKLDQLVATCQLEELFKSKQSFKEKVDSDNN